MENKSKLIEAFLNLDDSSSESDTEKILMIFYQENENILLAYWKLPPNC